MNPFDFVKSINKNSENLIETSENPELTEKSYAPWIINKNFSYSRDTVVIANEMNKYHHLDNALQYSFFLNIIRPKKRFAKWVKPEQVDNLECVKQYYGYNNQKASQVLSILSDAQLEIIKNKMIKGGKNDNSRGST